MSSSESDVYLRAAGLGAIAGLRSFSAPALLSHQISRSNKQEGVASLLGSPTVAAVLGVLAGGEIVADKLPWMPNRTDPPALIARAGSGAFVGATICRAKGRSAVTGALIGAAAAIAATFAGFHLRRAAVRDLGLPDTIVALVEDAVVVGAGTSLLRD
jgi:uncharacterized membrane protein